MMLRPFDFLGRPRVVYGPGRLAELGRLAKDQGFTRTLVCTDKGLMETPHVERALASLRDAGVPACVFSDFDENPDEQMAEQGRVFAQREAVDSIVGLGGGSSMDCAKAIGFLHANGGRMRDYWGYDKADEPLVPMIGVPTTAGTGSEAQSYALISDATTHVKMACGAPSASFRIALLDPELTLSQPASVTAVSGFDALAHAVESFVTTKRNPMSDLYAREAFSLLVNHLEHVRENPDDLAGRAAMQLGAYYAGVAIEHSMLGATHACANPLTERYGTPHGRAIAHLLPAVIRFNADSVSDRYQELGRSAKLAKLSPAALADRIERLAKNLRLETRLRDASIPEDDLPLLAKRAAEQWTGTFNPRDFDASGALAIYQAAF